MVYFDWSGGQWTYKKNPTPPSTSVPNNQCTNMSIDIKKHSEAVKSLGIWKSPGNNQKKRVSILIDKAKDWSRRISSSAILRHLALQSLKCGIWIYLAYTIPAISFSREDRDQIASALYIFYLPNLGANRNLPKPLSYIPEKLLGLGIPHPYQEQGIENLKT